MSSPYTVSDLIQDVENSISEDNLFWKTKRTSQHLMLNFEYTMKTRYPIETYVLDHSIDYETKVSIVKFNNSYVKVELHYFEETPFAFTVIDRSFNLQMSETYIFNQNVFNSLNESIMINCKSSYETKQNNEVGIMEDITQLFDYAKKLVC